MTKENQKVMYDNFMKMSKEADTDIKRANCLGYAKDILKSFPDFDPKIKEAAEKAKKDVEAKAKAEKEARAGAS